MREEKIERTEGRKKHRNIERKKERKKERNTVS